MHRKSSKSPLGSLLWRLIGKRVTDAVATHIRLDQGKVGIEHDKLGVAPQHNATALVVNSNHKQATDAGGGAQAPTARSRQRRCKPRPNDP